MKGTDVCLIVRRRGLIGKRYFMGHSSKNDDSFEKFKKSKGKDETEEKRGAKKKKPWARNRIRDWEEVENESGRYER